MANLFSPNAIRALRGHMTGDRDLLGSSDRPAQDVMGDEPDKDSKSKAAEDVKDAKDTKDVDPAKPFKPEAVDVVVVRAMLARSKKLPPDLVDIVFDHAEYWPHSSNEIDFKVEHNSELRVSGRSPSENKFMLRSYPVGLNGTHHKKDLSEELAWDMTEAKPQPLSKEHDPLYFKKLANYPTPKLVNPVRKIVFSFRSRDQGWGGEPRNKGTFKGSWTWLEAGLERFDADQTCDPKCTYDVRHKSTLSKESPLPVCALRPVSPNIEAIENGEGKFKYQHPLNGNPKYVIQRNRTATRTYADYEITWSWLDDIQSNSDEAMKLDEEHGRGRESLDGSFVRDLKLGDVITIWAMARFPGWINHVERAKVEVYWAV